MTDQPQDTSTEPAGLYDKLTPGGSLGVYTLVERLSTEGLEQVWRAKESGSAAADRPLRLTIVHAAAHGTHEALATFRARASALAHLRSPYIDRTFEPQLIAGMDVVVSNATNGTPLDQWLSQHVELLPVEQSRDLWLQLCEALAAAAELPAPYGPFDHRRLRPDQLTVIDNQGTPELRVGGFGLAADTVSTWSPEDHGTDAEAYLAPEQTRGARVEADQSALVFSLAVIAIELLTLRMRPALGRCWWELATDSDDATVAALAELRTIIPLPVLKVLSGAMLRTPAARYSSVRAFAIAFDQAWPEQRLSALHKAQAEAAAAARATARPRPPAPAKPEPKPRRNAIIAGAAGALALLAAATFFLRQPDAPTAASAPEGSAAAAAAPSPKPASAPVAAAAGGSGAEVTAGSGSGGEGSALVGANEGSAAASRPLLPMLNRTLGQECEQSSQCASGLCSNLHCVPEGFAFIPAGSFTRGTPTTELGHKGNEWQVEVAVTQPFLLQIAEVSQRDWKAVMESNPSKFAACGDGCPVDSVSWWEGVAYMNARSAKEGLTACYDLTNCTGDAKSPKVGKGGAKEFVCDGATLRDDCTGYRYPTEVEWEYAARAGTTTATYRGNIRLDSTRGFVCGPETALDGIAVWYCGAGVSYASGVSGAGHNGPAQVGPSIARRRTPNPWGLYDMLGNVSEWTDSGYINSPNEELPRTAGAVESRVVRGGSWSDPPLDLRAGARAQIEAVLSSPQRGFRPARRLTDHANTKNIPAH